MPLVTPMTNPCPGATLIFRPLAVLMATSISLISPACSSAILVCALRNGTIGMDLRTDWATRVVFYCEKKRYPLVSGMAAGRSTRWICHLFRCCFFWPSATFDRSLCFISFVSLQATLVFCWCAQRSRPVERMRSQESQSAKGARKRGSNWNHPADVVRISAVNCTAPRRRSCPAPFRVPPALDQTPSPTTHRWDRRAAMCSQSKSCSFRAFALYLVLRPLLDPFTSDPERPRLCACFVAPWIPRSIYLAASTPILSHVCSRPSKVLLLQIPRALARKRSSWNELSPLGIVVP